MTLDDFPAGMRDARFRPLQISLDHARRAGLIDAPYKDPFDRLLWAQAEIEEASLVSAGRTLRTMGVPIVR